VKIIPNIRQEIAVSPELPPTLSNFLINVQSDCGKDSAMGIRQEVML
jgi:hypothetical protein